MNAHGIGGKGRADRPIFRGCPIQILLRTPNPRCIHIPHTWQMHAVHESCKDAEL